MIRLNDFIDRFAEIMFERGWFQSGSGVPPGGTTAQVLTKLSNVDSDANWENLPYSGGPLLIDGGGAGTVIPAYVFRFDLGASA